MIAGLQLAILSGGLVSLGAALLVARLLPVEPDLADALERVSSTRSRNATITACSHFSTRRRWTVVAAIPRHHRFWSCPVPHKPSCGASYGNASTPVPRVSTPTN